MKQNLLLTAIVCVCFTLSGVAQTENSLLKDIGGEWIFESAELQERPLNSTNAYTKKTVVVTDEIVANTHFFPTPLWLCFIDPGEQISTLSMNIPVSSYDNIRCEWIKEDNGFRLNLLQAFNQQQSTRDAEEQTASGKPQQAAQSKAQKHPAPEQSTEKSVTPENASVNIEIMEVVASYYDVKLSPGKMLTMKYNYVYNAGKDKYIEGVFTVYMKKKL
jgi:hypothetical protein